MQGEKPIKIIIRGTPARLIIRFDESIHKLIIILYFFVPPRAVH